MTPTILPSTRAGTRRVRTGTGCSLAVDEDAETVDGPAESDAVRQIARGLRRRFQRHVGSEVIAPQQARRDHCRSGRARRVPVDDAPFEIVDRNRVPRTPEDLGHGARAT